MPNVLNTEGRAFYSPPFQGGVDATIKRKPRSLK
jgi:hypothetical protein